jgi:uncharacterized protein with LGFP repeats
VNGQRVHLGKLFGRALVSVAATAMAAVLLTPVALASPIGEAEEAMMTAWDKAGGDTSPLGARKGDVYPAGNGFALDFAGGKMYFTPDTGAKFVYGPILEKYDALGGPAGSDLGFPTINEVPGLAGPDSRVATFSASDKPVIYWTTDHGAHVVRGPLNAAWDKLGSSGGVLGVPVGDETYDGDVTSQKFSGGAISWNRKTNEFGTEPALLGDQLKDLKVTNDPVAAINMAWRAAGGASGPLGARKGGQYPIGGDGMAQDFAGGKVYYSTATGANAVESEILAKYEALGGPVGSELGFPIANESDGGIAPSSRIAVFSGPDKPAIFWTPDHGAFAVVEGIKVAWDKLKGPTGKLGAPLGDQSVDGDVVSQKFTGGKISWNRTKNTFTTDPANLAPLLSGLQVSGQKQLSGSAMPAQAKKFVWHWWYLLAVIPLLMLLVLLVLVLTGRRRRRTGHDAEDHAFEAPGYEPDQEIQEIESHYDASAAAPWAHEDAEFADERHPLSDVHPPEPEYPSPTDEPPARISWPRSAATADVPEDVPPAGYGHDLLGGPDAEPEAGLEEDDDFADLGFDEFEEDENRENPDDVDTTSIPVLTHPGFSGADDDEFDAAGDGGVADDVFTEAPPDARFADDVFTEAPPDARFADDVLTEDVASEAGYLDVSEVSEAPEPLEVAEVTEAADPAGQPRTGRHAAIETRSDDAEDAAETTDIIPAAGPAVVPERVDGPPVALSQARPTRPTIRLPLDDPYEAPDGYPIKASARFGLYYTPSSALYDDTLPEIWLASEEVAEANGFIKAD